MLAHDMTGPRGGAGELAPLGAPGGYVDPAEATRFLPAVPLPEGEVVGSEVSLLYPLPPQNETAIRSDRDETSSLLTTAHGAGGVILPETTVLKSLPPLREWVDAPPVPEVQNLLHEEEDTSTVNQTEPENSASQEIEPKPPHADAGGDGGKPPAPPKETPGAEFGPEPEPTPATSLEVWKAEMAEIVEDKPDFVKTIVDKYSTWLDEYNEFLEHPHAYQYVHHEDGALEFEDRPGMPPLLASFFGHNYDVVVPHSPAHNAVTKIFHDGTALVRRDTNPDEVAVAAHRLLPQIYALVDLMNQAEDSGHMVIIPGHATAMQRWLSGNAITTLNELANPPQIAAVMRQFVPKMAWEPHALPTDISVPEGYEERLHALWRLPDARSALMLGHPDDVVRGRLPLHAAFEVADTVARDHPDLAYELKVRVTIEALDCEATGRQSEEHQEMPFFTNTILPAFLLGAVNKNPGRSTLDYSAPLIDLVEQTWIRFSQETNGGPATDLLAAIQQYVPNQAEILARSAVALSRRGTFNLADVARMLERSSLGKSGLLVQLAILRQPNRPLISAVEIRALIGGLLPGIEAPREPIGNLMGVVEQLEADLYSTKLPLSRIPSLQGGNGGIIALDVDAVRGQAEVTLTQQAKGDKKTLTAHVDLRSGAVSLSTLDGEVIPKADRDKLRLIIEEALSVELAQLRANQPEERREVNLRFAPSDAPAVVGDESVSQKRRATAPEVVEVVPEATPAKTPGVAKVELTGVDSNTIGSLLKKEKIASIDAATLEEAVGHYLRFANQDGGSFGKRVNLDGFEAGVRAPLRQVNGFINGLPVRLYFLEGANNQLELVGIHLKVKPEQQILYIGNLLKSIRQQELSTRRADRVTRPKPNKPKRRK